MLLLSRRSTDAAPSSPCPTDMAAWASPVTARAPTPTPASPVSASASTSSSPCATAAAAAATTAAAATAVAAASCRYVAKVADFGLSRCLDSGRTHQTTRVRRGLELLHVRCKTPSPTHMP